MPFVGGHNQGSAEGLVLFIDNTHALHSQLRLIERMLMVKIAARKYDPKKAPKAFSYLTENAAKQYVKEFAESEELWPTWNMAFPKKIRDEANRDLTERFWSRIQVDPEYVAELARLRDSPHRAVRMPRR